MAKSLHSKVKRRYRAAKRQKLEETTEIEKIKKLNAKLQKIQNGISIDTIPPKNAFLYPDSADAVFPQRRHLPPIDFRSEAVRTAGFACEGNRRKFLPSEIFNLNLKNTNRLIFSGTFGEHVELGKQNEEELYMSDDNGNNGENGNFISFSLNEKKSVRNRNEKKNVVKPIKNNLLKNHNSLGQKIQKNKNKAHY